MSEFTDKEQMDFNDFANQYRDYLVAVSESVPCTFEEAGPIVARLAGRGYIWEKNHE